MFYTTGYSMAAPLRESITVSAEAADVLPNISTPEWLYISDQKQNGPVTAEQMCRLIELGIVPEDSMIFNIHMNRQMPCSVITAIKARFKPNIYEFLKLRASSPSTTLCGPNNCGKSLALKAIFSALGNDAFLMQCNRFYHFDHIGAVGLNNDFRPRDQFAGAFYGQDMNAENNMLDLQTSFVSLSDQNREKLFEICSDIIGATFEIRLVNESNQMFSPKYVSVGGEPLKISSTGTRLLMTLLCTLLDTRFTTVLIDEPEIGLSPRVQSRVAELLFKLDLREKYFPHLRQIYIATHSHLFINRNNYSDTFLVSRDEDETLLTQVKSRSDINRLKLNLLGNTLESLFLPSAIIITEGISDQKFLSGILGTFMPELDIAVINAEGDGHFARTAMVVTSAFGADFNSPYRDRLFAVLDSKHCANHKDIERAGVKSENIFIWKKNGIEYYYPRKILGDIFGLSDLPDDQLKTDRSTVSVGEHIVKKADLADRVCARLKADAEIDQEVTQLLDLLRKMLL